jgi:phosphoesterase, MJ0936 family
MAGRPFLKEVRRMKFLIVSDLHGSVPCFERALGAFEREKAGFLVICGDYLNHGPRNPLPEGYDPAALAARLNGMKERILGVRGNCDSEVDQMLLEFPCLGDYLVLFAGERRCIVTHGHLEGDRKLPLCRGDILVSGHTHIPVLEEREGIIRVNPGSVSLPKGGSEACCAVLDDDGIRVETLDGRPVRHLDPVQFRI